MASVAPEMANVALSDMSQELTLDSCPTNVSNSLPTKECEIMIILKCY